jgi:hypothetical protein
MKMLANTKTHQMYEMKKLNNTNTQIFVIKMLKNTKLCQIYEMKILGNKKHGNIMG